jgi:5'-3' exonuclease
VGEKTAAALVARYGSVEDIVAAAEKGSDGFPSGAANKVLAARDYLLVAPDAVRGRTDVPLDLPDDTLPAEPTDPERLVDLSAELGIDASVNRLLVAIAAARG